MNRIKYVVDRDDRQVKAALERLSPSSRKEVERALAILASNPEPEEYQCERVENGTFKLRVKVADGAISVLYELWRAERRVVLIEVKDVSRFVKALEWLKGLGTFGPD